MKTVIVNSKGIVNGISASNSTTQTFVPVKSWFENPVAIITALTTLAGVFKIVNGAYPQYTWIATGVSILLFVVSSIQSVVPAKAIQS